MNMEVGPETDELVAIHVMGWHREHAGIQDPPDPDLDYWTDDSGKILVWCVLWKPSVNIAQAWIGVDKMMNEAWMFEIHTSQGYHYIEIVRFDEGVRTRLNIDAPTMPLAICRA